MGMYDTVLVPCPNCGQEHEFQSKSGDRILHTVKLDKCPESILADVNRHSPYTCDCGCVFDVDLITRKSKAVTKHKNMITIVQYETAKKLIRDYVDQLRISDSIRWEKHQKELGIIYHKSKELRSVAEAKGYNSGSWIISDSFPKTKLQIGFGMIWSEFQKALVVGCTDERNSYYTSVPIYKPETDEWARLV